MVHCFCCCGNVKLEIELPFTFDIFSPGVDRLKIVSIVNMHICFFFHLKICCEKDEFRQV